MTLSVLEDHFPIASLFMCDLFYTFVIAYHFPSAHWCWWLGGRKDIKPIKQLNGGYAGMVVWARCRFAYGPADATALTVSCSSKSRLDLPFWYLLTRVVPSPGQRAIKWVLLLVIAFPAAFTGEDRNFIYGTDDDVTHFCMHNSGLRKTLPWLVDCA